MTNRVKDFFPGPGKGILRKKSTLTQTTTNTCPGVFVTSTTTTTTTRSSSTMNISNASGTALNRRRRSSMGSIRRRASIETSLPTISEHNDNAVTIREGRTTSTPNSQERRRSSVSFSASMTEVREYKTETSKAHFYSEQDIQQFRQEARFERSMARRASTGAMEFGMPIPNTYPYIGPMARRGSASSNSSDGSSSDSNCSALSASTASGSISSAPSMTDPAYVPMVTFAKLQSRKKEIRTIASRMSGLNVGSSPPNRRPFQVSSTTSTTSITQEEKSYQFSDSEGFSVPLDEVRNAIGNTSNPEDLSKAQFVSVSCPLPSRPSTARIA